MGSFIGHAVPGSFFFIYGVWTVLQAFRRHFRCRQSQRAFYSTMTFPFPFCPGQSIRRFPLESVLKMVLSGMGIIVEIIGGTNHITHRFDSIGNTQHITMYFFFGLSGVMDILVLKDLAPQGSDYVGLMIALLVEGALFKFHLFGREHLDILLHTLLLYVIGFTVVLVGVEAASRKHSLLPILRGLLFMLQGTWFWGVGYILYNPFPGSVPWKPDDHHTLMLAVVCFSWHVAFSIILVIAMGGVMGCCYRNWKPKYSKLNSVPLDVLQDEEVGLLERDTRTPGVSKDDVKGREKNGGLSLAHEDDLSDLEFEAPVAN